MSDLPAAAMLARDSARGELRQAGVCLQIGNLKISLPDDTECIAIDRDGEGGHFSLREFHDAVQEFVSARL